MDTGLIRSLLVGNAAGADLFNGHETVMQLSGLMATPRQHPSRGFLEPVPHFLRLSGAAAGLNCHEALAPDHHRSHATPRSFSPFRKDRGREPVAPFSPSPVAHLFWRRRFPWVLIAYPYRKSKHNAKTSPEVRFHRLCLSPVLVEPRSPSGLRTRCAPAARPEHRPPRRRARLSLPRERGSGRIERTGPQRNHAPDPREPRYGAAFRIRDIRPRAHGDTRTSLAWSISITPSLHPSPSW